MQVASMITYMVSDIIPSDNGMHNYGDSQAY
jgi:hypothetical protein